jgi:hypothetical protein
MDPMVIAGAAVIIIGAISAAVVAIISALGKMKAEINAGISGVAKTAAVIEGHANSAATRAEVIKTALEEQIVTLKTTINKQDEVASSLAKSAALVLEKKAESEII